MQKEHLILHEKFTSYGANAKEWTRKCVLLLPEIERHRIWERKGFGSIYEYAAKLAGMSHDTVNEGLRILKKIEEMPELKRVVEVRGIGAVRPVATIVTPETADFWAEKAMAMSKNTLETYVREFKRTFDDGIAQSADFSGELGRPRTADFRGVSRQAGAAESAEKPHVEANRFFVDNEMSEAKKVILAVDVDLEVVDELRKLKGDGDWNSLMNELLAARRAKHEAKKPKPIASESRYIPAKIKKHVIKRTNGICSFPGCAKPHEILHHTRRFALEKVHDPDRLEPLCKSHERIAHLGLIENENTPAKGWRVRLWPDEMEEKFKVDTAVQKYRVPN